MSVTEVRYLPNREGEQSDDWTQTITIKALVVTDNRADGPITVFSSPLVPRLWTQYLAGNESHLEYGGPYLLLSKRKVTEKELIQETGGSLWELELEYTTHKVQKYENPLDQPVRYSLEWAQYDRVVEKDKDGNPLVNTIGDLFTDPPYKEEDARPVLRAYRNEPDVATRINFIASFRNALNSDSFHGMAPRTCRMRNITSGDLQTQNGVDYYKFTYEIEFNEDTWDPDILNRGHRAKDSNGKIYDLPKKEVRNLKQDGTVVGPDDDPYYINFKIRNEKAFSDLNI